MGNIKKMKMVCSIILSMIAIAIIAIWFSKLVFDVPKVELVKVSHLTDYREFKESIEFKKPRSPYEHLLNPHSEGSSSYVGFPVWLPASGTYLFSNQFELVELSEIDKTCQIVQRIPIDSYGYSKEEYFIGNHSLVVFGDSLWVEISQQKKDFPLALVEQQWYKPDRPYCAYEVGSFALYALDPVHRQIFLFRPNSPLIHVYDLSEKKIIAEYQTQGNTRWGYSALYNSSANVVFIQTETQSGGHRINIFDPKTGQMRTVCKGWDIRQGPNNSIYYKDGKKLYRYQHQAQIRELVYAVPYSAVHNLTLEIGHDPSYVRCWFRDSAHSQYRVDIDLKRNEYQIQRFDVQSYIKSYIARYPQSPRGLFDIDMSDESFWESVD